MLFQRPDQVPSELVVVTPIFNPLGYRSRWKLYEDFKYMVERAGVKLMTVEVAFANREFAVTKPGDPWNLQLRTNSELWLKENLINLAVARIPQDWSYVAWVDADIAFARHDWANETIRKLQHHPVVQMWSQATDLTPDYETLQGHRSFAWCYHNDGEPKMGRYGMHGRKHHWHPGYGWAWRREAWDAVGGLIDWAILGSADDHMAKALVGKLDTTMHGHLTPAYKEACRIWQDRATKYLHYDVGYVPGTILHYWHGNKTNRQYVSRWKILVDNKFDPTTDLKRDAQGLWQLVVETPRQAKLRDQLRRYFSQRDEDNTSL